MDQGKKMSDPQEKEAFDQALKQELEKRINQIQSDISQNLQSTIQQSLGHLEESKKKLEEERKKLEAEKDEVHARLKEISARADQMANEWFHKRTQESTESIRKEQIRDLVYHHLQRGKPVEEICDWLQVERKMVEDLIVLMDRKVDYKKEQFMKDRIQLPHNPRLVYKSSGRAGTIIFQNDLSSFEVWWEFAGGKALVIIDIPSIEQWVGHTGLPLDQRDEILQFIAEQVIEDQTSSAHKYEISERWITILR
jgi:hypothetical protein